MKSTAVQLKNSSNKNNTESQRAKHFQTFCKAGQYFQPHVFDGGGRPEFKSQACFKLPSRFMPKPRAKLGTSHLGAHDHWVTPSIFKSVDPEPQTGDTPRAQWQQ